MSTAGGPVPRGAKVLAVALALLAPARMAWIVFSVGENNLSNDYVGRVGTVVAILEGRYDFRNLFTDTFITYGHSWLALLPIYWFDARFFAWNMNVELGIGLLLAAAKTLLFWLALAPSISSVRRSILLVFLVSLGFSASQVTSFTFGESTLQMQIPQVGLGLGAVAIARFGHRCNLRCLLLAFGGLLASWSWGGGVMVWPVFILALAASGERNVRRWGALGLAVLAGLSQYIWILGVRRAPSPIERPGFSQPWRYLDLIGRPFSNDTGWHLERLAAAVAFGVAGLLLAAAAFLIRRNLVRDTLPALMMLGWSVLVAAEIGFFRRDPAPWYIVSMTVFWMGLAGLLAATSRLLASTGYATIAVGLLFSNRTWEDKQFYLPSRSPASAACLREWRTSAVPCHDRLFQWGGTNLGEAVVLGAPLERLHLSVFSSRRTYLLQGDVAVGRVAVETLSRQAFLSRDGSTPGNPNDYHRLDLVLAPGGAVRWRVDVPASATVARFLTRVRATPRDPMLARAARVALEGDAGQVRTLVPRGGSGELALDLAAHAGRSVTLRIEAEEASSGALLVFEAPRVEIRIPRTARTGAS